MEEISVSQVHEVFSNFIQQLNEKKVQMNTILEFQMGTSSAFASYTNSITNNIIPFFFSIVEKYNLLYKDNTRISSLYENEIQKSDLFENAYSEVSTFLTRKEDQYNYLWLKIAEIGSLLLQSHTYNVELQTKLVTAIEIINSQESKIAKLQKENDNLNGLQQWILTNFEEVFTSPNMIKNVQLLIKILIESNNDEKAEKIKELEKEISELKSSIEEIKTDSKQKQEAQQNEIEELKNTNLSLNETIEKLIQENQQLKTTNKELTDKVSYLNYESEKKEKMENAINDLCNTFPFLKFNGTKFDYNVKDVSQQQVLEKSLLSTRKENEELTNQVNELRNKLREAKSDFENNLKKSQTSHSFEINELKLSLKQSTERYDKTFNELTKLKSERKKLLNDKDQLAKNFEEISKENRDIKFKYNEIMKRQDAHIIRYQDSLDQISKFYTGGTSLSKLNDTSKSSSIEYPKLFSPNISIPDSSFTTQIENTPQLEVYKEANENLQKENDQLKHEKDSLSDKIKSLENSISELTATNSDLTLELTESKNSIEETKRSMNEWQQLYEKNVSSNKQFDQTENLKVAQLEIKLKESIADSLKFKAKIDELTEKAEKEEEKSKELINEQTKEIEQLQQDLLRKEAELMKIRRQLKDSTQKTEESQSNTEKDQELTKLRKENDEYQKHINLLETQIELNHHKQQQLQQQLQLLMKHAVKKSSTDLDLSQIDPSQEGGQNITILLPPYSQKDKKPIPPPEAEEPVFNDHHDEDDENENQENEEENENENENQETEQNQDDDAENDDQNDKDENLEENENQDNHEQEQEQKQEQNEQELEHEPEAEPEQEPEKEPETKPVKEKQKEVTIVSPTSESQHQYQYHNQQDRNRDKGRDNRSQNYLRRSQSLSSEKNYYQQNKKSTNTNNNSNSQKSKGGNPERRPYQKRSNPKRKK